MYTPRNLIIAGLAASALIMVNAVPATFDLLGPQPAFAKNGNGGGHGNGNGGGNSAGKSSGGGDGESASTSSPSQSTGPGKSASAPGHNKSSGSPVAATAKAPAATVAKAPKAQGLDAEIAGLHAVNANLQAFIHASPNSKVGKIAAYATALVATEEATAARNAAQETFDAAATALADATAAHEASITVLTDVYGYSDTSPAALQASKDALLLLDTTLYTPEELAAYNAEIAAIDQALADAAALDAAQTVYDDANQALIDAEQALVDAQGAATDALNAAANANRTPVDDEVRTYVDTKLQEGGILDYYRAQGSTVVAE